MNGSSFRVMAVRPAEIRRPGPRVEPASLRAAPRLVEHSGRAPIPTSPILFPRCGRPSIPRRHVPVTVPPSARSRQEDLVPDATLLTFAACATAGPRACPVGGAWRHERAPCPGERASWPHGWPSCPHRRPSCPQERAACPARHGANMRSPGPISCGSAAMTRSPPCDGAVAPGQVALGAGGCHLPARGNTTPRDR
jgi:hypothetical protein